MTELKVKRYIKNLRDLPTTPALLEKILSLIENDESSTNELCLMISHDQAMAQRVLKVANSVLFAHSGEITNIDQALLFLGIDRIKSIAVGMSVMHIFPSRGSFKIENLWLHSYEVAYISSLLSEAISITQPQDCFLAGLLHDIGRIIFYNMDNKRFHRIETTDTLLDQEMEQYGCTHPQAGAWFAEEVGLPNSIVTAIKYHHLPSAAPEEMHLVSLVSLAGALTRMFMPRVEDDGIWTQEHNAILLEFALTQEQIHNIGRVYAQARAGIENFFASSK